VTEATEQLLQSAMALSEDERLQLVEALLAECDRALARPFDDAWLAEIQRRSAQIDAGTATLTPWPEVKRRVRRRLEGRRDG
jgi:putative addiction module component (TIGR02574 family)